MKTVCINTAFIGDIVLTAPLLRALKQIDPTGELAFITTPAGKTLMEGLPFVDEVIAYDKRGVDAGFRGLTRFAGHIKQRHFDLALSAHRSARTALTLYLAGIPARIGYRESTLSLLYTTVVPREMDMHEIDRCLSLVTALEHHQDEFDHTLELPASGLQKAEMMGLLDEHGVAENKLKVAFVPGSVWGTKRWPASAYGELAKLFRADHDCAIALVGSDEDAEVCGHVMENAGFPLANLSGKTRLKDLAALMSHFDIVVTNDTGPMHIAVAAGRPTVAIFGPTVPSFGYAPIGEHTRIVELEGLDCRPCHHHGPQECPREHFKCMRELTPAVVYNTCRELLATAAQ